MACLSVLYYSGGMIGNLCLAVRNFILVTSWRGHAIYSDLVKKYWKLRSPLKLRFWFLLWKENEKFQPTLSRSLSQGNCGNRKKRKRHSFIEGDDSKDDRGINNALKKFRDVSNEGSFVKAKGCNSERSPNKGVTIDTVKTSSADKSKGNVTRHHCCLHYTFLLLLLTLFLLYFVF